MTGSDWSGVASHFSPTCQHRPSMRLSWHLPLAVCPERKTFTSAFFEVLHALCFLWSCHPVGHTAKLRVSVGGRHSREWTQRGRCGARNAVTPPEPGADREPAASCWKDFSPAHSSMPATAALELNMARILIFFVVQIHRGRHLYQAF